MTTANETVGSVMARSGVQFGTSGARGEVTAMTDYVCYAYTQGFLTYLADLGEFASGARVAIAGDLRPSTPRIIAACIAAVRDLGGEAVFCGYVPTPALALYAFAEAIPSLMVTGSHIPDDRNGIKFYRPAGEVLKSDEAGMRAAPLAIDAGKFDAGGMLREAVALPAVTDAETAYVARYLGFFGEGALASRKIGVYQHSAVGRDIVTRIVALLGAEVVPLGRAERFIPVDTEAIRPEDVALAKDWAPAHGLDAIVSTDGDSDRPLLADHQGEWLRGDVLGVLCARALGLTAIVTPVSSNSVLERSGAFAVTARTRIGSPYVIAEMNALLAKGQAGVAGYEANGGFLLASDIARDGRVLTALPTRDAVLPILAALVAAGTGRLTDLIAQLPRRVTFSDRIQAFATERSEALFAGLLAGDDTERLARLDSCFGDLGGAVTALDLTDGIRMTTASGAIIHLRRSGNAPELRCYAEADEAAAAQALAERALAKVTAGLPI